MSAPWPILPLFALGVTWLLLVLVAWDGAAFRRERRVEAGGPTAHDVIEVRLAVWPFLGAFLWTAARMPSAGAAPENSELALLLLFMPATGLAGLGLGTLAGRRAAFPRAWRWLLAPFHGLAGWIGWLRALARRRDLAAGSAAAVAAIERPGEPEDSPSRGVRDLAEFRLEEVMIPRSQTASLRGSASIAEAMGVVRSMPHTLYPVYDESVDQLLGVVQILDLAEPEVRERQVRDLVRPVPILPETVRGLRLFRDLAEAPIPAALVVDEYGGMAGLVTAEDLVEVLVGDLEGEPEAARDRIRSMGPDVYRVDGTCTIEECSRRLGRALPEGEYETVAGLVLHRLGGIPLAGESITVPGLRLTVEEATDRRILWVRAERLDGRAEAGKSGV